MIIETKMDRDSGVRVILNLSDKEFNAVKEALSIANNSDAPDYTTSKIIGTISDTLEKIIVE